MTLVINLEVVLRLVIALLAVAVIFITGYTEVVRLATVTEARQRLHELNGRHGMFSKETGNTFFWMGIVLMVLSTIGIFAILYGLYSFISRLL